MIYFYYNFDHCIPHTYQKNKTTTAPNTKEIIQKMKMKKKNHPPVDQRVLPNQT